MPPRFPTGVEKLTLELIPKCCLKSELVLNLHSAGGCCGSQGTLCVGSWVCPEEKRCPVSCKPAPHPTRGPSLHPPFRAGKKQPHVTGWLSGHVVKQDVSFMAKNKGNPFYRHHVGGLSPSLVWLAVTATSCLLE